MPTARPRNKSGRTDQTRIPSFGIIKFNDIRSTCEICGCLSSAIPYTVIGPPSDTTSKRKIAGLSISHLESFLASVTKHKLETRDRDLLLHFTHSEKQSEDRLRESHRNWKGADSRVGTGGKSAIAAGPSICEIAELTVAHRKERSFTEWGLCAATSRRCMTTMMRTRLQDFVQRCEHLKLPQRHADPDASNPLRDVRLFFFFLLCSLVMAVAVEPSNFSQPRAKAKHGESDGLGRRILEAHERRTA
ncbi:hypothetical protein AXG93_1520s1450 [Marchantia polymorpha subsp. ruderalis]|uniref:Uncharacterized protein n=1 Tax=Marchantia polymorpha subsp. ruderalis TaxID=1480154 RepID=A0A176VI25_MARPO|nr:hypothetical protein AXG93_1520s1450 [Marchantia polymorpha subsp. ruderalis]